LSAWERLLEAARVLGNFSFSLLGLLLHGGFTPFGLEMMMGYEIGGRDANERHNWSMKQV